MSRSGPLAAVWPDSRVVHSKRAQRVHGQIASMKATLKARLGRFWVVVPLLLTFVLLIALGAGVAFWDLSRTTTNYPGAHFNTGNNAVWLEHNWAGQAHTSADYEALATRLQSEQVSYVYAHVGPLDSDGTIPASRAPNAMQLADALHARLRGVHVLAWIGQLSSASGLPADQVVSLDDSAVRSRIATTAAHFVAAERFDGVHYDIEPILNNDAHFLDLLDETRALLPSRATISMAAEKWAPSARLASWALDAGHANAWWTSYYYSALASHVDQMVVMAYNTGMPTGSLYQLFVKEQAQHILEAVRTAHHPPQLLIGIPTYPGDDTWHHAAAENMATGLAGVTAGLNSAPTAAPFTGIAIYRYALTTPQDWSAYNSAWLGH